MPSQPMQTLVPWIRHCAPVPQGSSVQKPSGTSGSETARGISSTISSIHPLVMEEVRQEASHDGPQPTDPEVLARIEAPVLVLVGQQTRLDTFLGDSARHVARHVADSRVRELPGVGHYAPMVAPEPVAKELISFFESMEPISIDATSPGSMPGPRSP
jgi:hypothetical protein